MRKLMYTWMQFLMFSYVTKIATSRLVLFEFGDARACDLQNRTTHSFPGRVSLLTTYPSQFCLCSALISLFAYWSCLKSWILHFFCIVVFALNKQMIGNVFLSIGSSFEQPLPNASFVSVKLLNLLVHRQNKNTRKLKLRKRRQSAVFSRMIISQIDNVSDGRRRRRAIATEYRSDLN